MNSIKDPVKQIWWAQIAARLMWIFCAWVLAKLGIELNAAEQANAQELIIIAVSAVGALVTFFVDVWLGRTRDHKVRLQGMHAAAEIRAKISDPKRLDEIMKELEEERAKHAKDGVRGASAPGGAKPAANEVSEELHGGSHNQASKNGFVQRGLLAAISLLVLGVVGLWASDTRVKLDHGQSITITAAEAERPATAFIAPKLEPLYPEWRKPEVMCWLTASGSPRTVRNPARLSWQVAPDGDWRRTLAPGGVLHKLAENGWLDGKDGELVILIHRPLGEMMEPNSPMLYESLLRAPADIRHNLAATIGAVDQFLHERGGRALYYMGKPHDGLTEAEFWLAIAPLLHLRGDICLDAAHGIREDTDLGRWVAQLRDYLAHQNRHLWIEPPARQDNAWLSTQWGMGTMQLMTSGTSRWLAPDAKWAVWPNTRTVNRVNPTTGVFRAHGFEEWQAAAAYRGESRAFIAHRDPAVMTKARFLQLRDAVPPMLAPWWANVPSQINDTPQDAAGGSGG